MTKSGLSKQRRRLTRHSPSHISAAVEAVESGRLNISQAAAEYHIARTTLSDWVHKPNRREWVGSPTILTPAEEQILANFIRLNVDEFTPLSFSELQVLLIEVFKRTQKRAQTEGSTNMEEKLPEFSYGWLTGFRDRHRLVFRIPQPLTPARLNVSPILVQNWFAKHGDYLRKNPELWEALQNPERVFNTDELGVPEAITPRKVRLPPRFYILAKFKCVFMRKRF